MAGAASIESEMPDCRGPVQRSETANDALLRGDIATYRP